MVDQPGENIQELASACVRYVHNAVGVLPDFSPDTLPLVDHYLATLDATTEPEVLTLVASTAGAYFGEVAARTLGPAHWHVAGADYANYRLQFESVFLHFNPMGQALEAVLKRRVDGWNANLGLRAEDTEAVRAGLERLGEVREQDYYRLATRMEALEQVVVTLASRAVTQNRADRRYTANDYAATAEPLDS